MKKILLCFMALFAFFAVNAAEVTVTAGEGLWTTGTDATYGDGYEITVDNVFVGLYKYNNNTAIPEPISEMRHYKNAMMVINTTNGETITNVVFNCTGGSNRCNDLTINGEVVTADTDANTITWSGQATELLAEATSAQNRYSSIVITTTEGGEVVLTAPTFSPEGGTYYSAQSVTISAVAGASIYYTTDGSIASSSSNEYTGPIEVATTTTINAIAVLDGQTSEPATATYIIAEPTMVDNIAAFLSTTIDEVVEFANPVTAIFQNGYYTYITDETGTTLVYGSVDNTYSNGDIIPAGFMGLRSHYNGPQLNTTLTDGSSTASTFLPATSYGDPVDPTVVELGAIDAGYVNQYVRVNGVKIISEESGSYTNYYAIVGGGEGEVSDILMLYARFSSLVSWDDLAALSADVEYDVIGFVADYNGTIEIYVTEIVGAGSGDDPNPDPEPTEGVIYSATFPDADSDGAFTVQDVALGSLSYVWSYSSYQGDYFWKASGYYSGAGGNNEADSWIVSPEISLAGYSGVEMVLDAAWNYLNGAPIDNHLDIMVTTAYTGDVTTTDWTEVSATGWPEGNSWAFYTIDPIDMSQFDGETIRVAFRYMSSTENAPTFEFQNLILTGVEGSSVGEITAGKSVKAIGLDGKIAILGDARNVEVYTIGGAVIAKGNLSTIDCAAGVYVVKVDGAAYKVIVK